MPGRPVVLNSTDRSKRHRATNLFTLEDDGFNGLDANFWLAPDREVGTFTLDLGAACSLIFGIILKNLGNTYGFKDRSQREIFVY
jgi:hypothetical protein